MEYKELINKLNNYDVTVKFSVDNYAHYNDCQIISYEKAFRSGKTCHMIDVRLTKDLSERVGFIKTFEENIKLFYFGRKGSFTLKQIWDKVRITEIIYR